MHLAPKTIVLRVQVQTGFAVARCKFDAANEEINVAWAITDGGPGVGVKRVSTKRSDWRDVPLTDAAPDRFSDRYAASSLRSPTLNSRKT